MEMQGTQHLRGQGPLIPYIPVFLFVDWVFYQTYLPRKGVMEINECKEKCFELLR